MECGCPVEDLATDWVIHDTLQRFKVARALYECNGCFEFLDKTYQEIGLKDEPETLLELEIIYKEAQQKALKTEWKKI